jgi:hypothetical protein
MFSRPHQPSINFAQVLPRFEIDASTLALHQALPQNTRPVDDELLKWIGAVPRQAVQGRPLCMMTIPPDDRRLRQS